MLKIFCFLLLLLTSQELLSNPINTELGTPKSAQTLEVVTHFEFSSGFHCYYGIPLWVSYNLNKEWFGDVPRWSKNFMPDSSLPQSCWIRHSDYTNSGYDRGHMVRSEERTRTAEENRKTFLTSNIIPQKPELNQQTWLKMEYYAEKLAKDSLKEMFIYAGPIFAKDKPVTMYNNKVAIPDSCYKIIVVMHSGSTLNDVNENTEVIACVFPNNDANVKNFDWTTFKTSVFHIEQSTGLDFLDNVPDNIEAILEGRPVSVLDNVDSGMLIYPNPASDYVVVPVENYTVYNSFGIVMGNYTSSQLDVSGYPQGVYFVKGENSIIIHFIRGL